MVSLSLSCTRSTGTHPLVVHAREMRIKIWTPLSIVGSDEGNMLPIWEAAETGYWLHCGHLPSQARNLSGACGRQTVAPICAGARHALDIFTYAKKFLQSGDAMLDLEQSSMPGS